ncbi:TBC domain-containing protein [Colletotrichum orchidophilum]|uniref:GTPase-activating protein GYP5 n=1 Tax=Colletotrichum orchidophilum TaxID=1209926 RepID=A0A1G4AVU3_9PEZI|nr:TBC domain-containing protein [Colletotrichum orchidophilum]OHE93216.1 TBC domain-containing protein [Colletotrichum orchidophilum]
MSQPDGPVATVSPEVNKETKEKRLSTDSDSDSDKENEKNDSLTEPNKQQDAFEDAVVDVADVAEVRSLTQRTPSVSKQPSAEETDPEPSKKEEQTEEDRVVAPAPPSPTPDDHFVDEDFVSDHEDVDIKRKASPVSHRLSNTSNLDDVKLDDDHPAPHEEPETKAISPVEEKPLPPKKISISSITGALPSMPWSPPAEPLLAKSPAVPAAVPPQAPLPPPPGPPTRKLTSPFSWLSRNSTSKEKETSPPPQASPRRNTASSIATLTSNPDMSLGRLDEEKESDGTNGVLRHSLKDRFKMVRLREEVGVTLPSDDDKPVPPPKGLGFSTPPAPNGNDRELGADQAPKSPLPTTPNPALAPGTVSGVSAGPSDMSDSQVDWDLWQSVVYEGPAVVQRTSAEELNKAIASGIPNAIRGVVWQVLAQSNNEELEIMYRELVARGTDKGINRNSQSTVSSSSNGNLSIQNDTVNSSASSVHSEQSAANGMPSPHEKSAEAVLKAQQAATVARQKKQKEDTAMLQKLEKTIRRDLGARTSFSKYAAAAGLQEGLFGVCKAYALFDEGVGYAQGMNFLIMPLLFNMTEEEAFCLLVRLMNHYHLRDLFIQDMPGLHKNLYIFERLLEDYEPALYCHLRRRSISPHLYATQWFLTLFAYRFPLQLVLRIYDLILSEGLSAILRFGIVLMQKNAANLLAISDMQQLTVFLKDKVFDAYIDTAPSAGSILENGFFGSSSSSMDKEVYRADQLVRDACDLKITPEILKAYTTEWEEKTRAEKDREAELEGLRTANINFAIKVRKLEERVEAYDSEQAALATELVHTKVENEELKDENESLKGQVRELRNVIEKQPEELENAWKAEREDLMKRNLKVHEENEKLEKEMAELEEELVQTKMQYAEINSQHETLNRKWTDLKRQFA